MALADPQSVTIGGVATTLPRTGLTLEEGQFQDATGQVRLTVTHGTTRRTRHTVKLAKSMIVADPLVPSVNQNVAYSAHLVIDMPRNGVTADQAKEIAAALTALCTATYLAKVIAGES